MKKPYDVGLIVGRFQMLHNGHEKLFNTANKLCDRLLIFVGSAQEMGTIRNPFDVNTRIEMIKEVYLASRSDDILAEAAKKFCSKHDVRLFKMIPNKLEESFEPVQLF